MGRSLEARDTLRRLNSELTASSERSGQSLSWTAAERAMRYRWALRGYLLKVPVQRRTAHSQVLGYIPRSVTVRPHTPRGRDVTGIGHLLGPPELGAAGPRCVPLQRFLFLDQLALVFGKRPRTPIIMRPAAVEESIPSLVEINVMPRSVRALTVSKMCNALRPSRSSFHTTTVSPSRT